MLALIPLQTHRAKSTGNLANKGIPTTSIRCIQRIHSQAVYPGVYKNSQCTRKARFILSRVSPTFKHRIQQNANEKNFRFAGLTNSMLLLCPIHVLPHIEQYQANLQTLLRQYISPYWLEDHTRYKPATIKAFITRHTRELERSYQLITLLQKEMKKDKEACMDLIEV